MTSALPQTASHLATEVGSQPDDWALAVSRLPQLAPLLPVAGQRVATIGCGTSWFMGQAYAEAREGSGQGVTDAWAASEHRLSRGYDKVVVITRSGTTSEVIGVIDELRASGTPHVSIVATAGTPVAEASESLILMSDFDEKSVVQTRFATTTLALLRASLGEDLNPAIAQAREVLAEDEATAVGHLLDAEQVTFVGTGAASAIATEAALKLRESAQFWSESYPSMEYRHGPISIASPNRVVWALGEVPPGLAQDVARTGAHFEHRDIDPMAELVRVQRYCLARSAALGLDPDQPRNLTRSIILN